MCYRGPPPVVHAPSVVPSVLESDSVVGGGAQGLWSPGKGPAGPLRELTTTGTTIYAAPMRPTLVAAQAHCPD
eukprot:270290-Pyramimonas_sp.AAC.1